PAAWSGAIRFARCRAPLLRFAGYAAPRASAHRQDPPRETGRTWPCGQWTKAPVPGHLHIMHSGGPMSRHLQDVSTALEGMVAALAPSLVSVMSHRMQASGFAWRAGLVVTSDEGLAEEGEVRVILPGGDSMVAHPVGRDPGTAIAVLRIDRTDLPPVALAAAVPPPGALALALGAESGAPTASLGLVSISRGPWQSLRGGEIDARLEL